MPVAHLHSHLRIYSAISQVVFHVVGTQIHLATTKSRKVFLRDVNRQHTALFSLNDSLCLPTQHFIQYAIKASTVCVCVCVINSSNKKLICDY